MHLIRRGCLATSAMACILAATAPAWGQDRPIGTPASTTAQDGPSTAADIIVTAQKREQNVQDVPISMTVISGQQIAAFHDNDLHSLQNSIPNLYIERLNFADTIYLRGFGTGPANFAFDPSVSMYVDGVYAGRPQQFSSPFFDIERVEVARGPQGALFGKNTAAGAVSIVTANPTRTLEASLTGAYNFDLDGTEFSGFVSGPLSDTVSVRLSGRALDYDGYIPNVVSGKDNPRRQERLGRFAIRYEPAEGYDFTAKVQYAETDSKGENQVRASLTASGPFDPVQANDPNPFGYPNAAHFSGWNSSLTGNIPVGDHILTFVTGYSTFDASRANSYSTDVPAIFLNRIIEDFEQYSAEARISSPVDQPLNYIVGVYYDWHKYHVGQPFNYSLLGGILAGTTAGDLYQTGRTYSAFGQATYNVTDSLRLIGSLRYTKVEKDGHYVASSTGFPLLGPSFFEDNDLNEDHLDPSATLQYDFDADVMAYATYARGSKSGGFVSNNRRAGAPAEFDPEKSESFEIGVKSTLADRRLVINVAAYNTTIRDLQTSVFCPDCLPPGFVTKNAGSATSRGIEVSVSWTPVDRLQFTLNGAYQDAKYDDFLGANCLSRQPASVCSVSAPIGAPNHPQFNDLAGEPLTFASKWTGNVQAQYIAPIGQALELTSMIKVAYRSRYYNSDDQSLIYGVQPGFAKIDARLELAARDGPWSVALVGKNLTDKDTFSFANAWPAPLTATPTAHKYLDEPRTILVEATVRF
jgi:iron complex outermembrane recepter protein